MRGVMVLSVMLAAVGCQKQPTAGPAEYAVAPHLPSPRAGTYARVPADPPDPVIRALTYSYQWDASLGGAAAGLALGVLHDDFAITGWRVREASWRAGYPYPVSRVRAWSTPPQSPPPKELVDWLDAIPAGDDLGVVRGRNAAIDVWVALTAHPRQNIGVQPRQLHLGGRIDLPALPGCAYAVATPDGLLFEGSLEIAQRFDLEVPGEWLFRVEDAAGTVALFPVYAGMIPPETTLLDDADLAVVGSVLERVDRMLARVRELYGAEPWVRDVRMDAAAESMLSDTPPNLKAVAGSLGYDPATFSRWGCTGTSVEDCLDRVIWDPRSRPGLLGNTRDMGLAVRVGAGRVRIVALIAPG
ncbi:MAG: hypothetical protein ACI8PZ_002193 [Myxococcota bacterium]|jgi:hypothetical protein